MTQREENGVRAWLRQNGSSVVTLLHFTVLYAVRANLSLVAEQLGATGVQLSAPSFVYSIVQVLVAWPLGRIVDRSGPKLPAMAGSLLTCLGTAGLAFSPHWIFVVLCGMLMGIGHTLVILGTQRVAVNEGRSHSTANLVGFVMFASSGGQFIGPILGGWVMDTFRNAGFLAVAALGLTSIAAALLLPARNLRPAQEKAQTGRSGGQRFSANVFLAILISAVVLFCQETTLTYFPLYAEGMGMTATAIGAIFSVRGVASMLVRPFLGPLSERHTIRTLMTASLFVGGLTIIAYVCVRPYWALLLVGALSGAFLGLAAPLTLMLIAIYAPAEKRGEAISIRIVCNYLGQSASAAIFGVFSTFFGYAPVFWISGALMILFSRLNHWRLKEELKSN